MLDGPRPIGRVVELDADGGAGAADRRITLQDADFDAARGVGREPGAGDDHAPAGVVRVAPPKPGGQLG